jgi:toxin ParE1/3/4
MDEVVLLVDLLTIFPELGRARGNLGPGVRSFRVRRFRHVLFYRLETDAIVLLRLLHGARRVTRKAVRD